jgi:hypothetical protein
LKTWGVDGGVDVLAEKRSSIDGFLLEFKEDTRDWTANARKELRIGWLMGNRLERLGSDPCVREMSTAFGVALNLLLILESGKAFYFGLQLSKCRKK